MSARFLATVSLLFLAAPALADDPPRVDELGDPLTPGVQVRLGSTRLLHQNKITAMSFTDAGDLIASGSMDGAVHVWSAVDGTELFTTSVGEGGVRSLSLSDDGERLAVGSTRDYVRVWNVFTGEELVRVDGGNVVSISPDGKTLAVGGRNEELRLVDIDEDVTIRTEGFGYDTTTIVYSPDGKRIAKTAWNRERVEESEGVQIAAALEMYDHDNGKLLWRETFEKPRLQEPSFAAGGSQVVVVDEDGEIFHFDVETGDLLGQRTAIENCVFVAAAMDRVVALGDGGGVVTWQADEEPQPLDAGNTTATACSISSDGKILALALGREVTIWELAERKRRLAFDRSTTPISALAYTPDGKRIVTGSFGGDVRVWDASSGKALEVLSARPGRVFAVDVSSDGARIGAADWTGDVRLWGTAEQRLLASFVESDASVTGFDFSPDGKRVACTSTDGVLRVIDVETGQVLVRGEDLQGTSLFVAFSPDGESLVVAGRDLLLIDANDGSLVRRWSKLGSPVGALAWSPDGTHVAVGMAARTILLYDVSKEGDPRVLSGHDGRVTALAFTPAGSVLLSGSYGDHSVRVWDVAGGIPLGTLEGYTEQVLSLAVSPDGTRVAVGGIDPNTVVLELADLRAPGSDE